MSTRDLALAFVAVVSIIASWGLLHDGTGGDAIAPIIALGGVAIGRISGANSPTAVPAVPAAIDVDAYEAH